MQEPWPCAAHHAACRVPLRPQSQLPRHSLNLTLSYLLSQRRSTRRKLPILQFFRCDCCSKLETATEICRVSRRVARSGQIRLHHRYSPLLIPLCRRWMLLVKSGPPSKRYVWCVDRCSGAQTLPVPVKEAANDKQPSAKQLLVSFARWKWALASNWIMHLRDFACRQWTQTSP